MKALLILLAILLGTSQPILSQEESFTDTNKICPGHWILSNEAGWYIKNEFGLILPLSGSTTVYGCAKQPIELTSDLAGPSVTTKCPKANAKNSMPDVLSITIIFR